MKSTLNLKLFLSALSLAIALLIPYEYYWRVIKHWPASYDVEDIDMWAEWRSKVDDLNQDDVVILGSSRGHFDINIHLWDSITGNRPLMLAYPGSSPFHPVADIVDNSQFDGILIVSVAPGLFFTVSDSWGAGRGKAFVDRYHKATYAQKFNHFLFKHIDPLFSYSDPGINLKNLVDRLPFANRDSVSTPDVWPPMVEMDRYRGVRMTDCFEKDSVLIRRQTDIWFPPEGKERKNRYKDSIDVIMEHYLGLAKKFKERGGRIAFIRPPVSNKYLETEPVLFPREEYWDRLIRESESPGFHFQDHPDTRNMDPPEWSHLSKSQSDIYTKTIIHLLRQEALIQ